MTDLKDVNRMVTVGNGKKMVVKKNGTWNGFVIHGGIKKSVTLTDVDYIPICDRKNDAEGLELGRR